MNLRQALEQWPQPEKDWEKISLPFSIGSNRPEFLGTGDHAKILMRYFRNAMDNSLNGHIWFAESCFGPPGFVHGGVSAYILDEILGTTAWMNDMPSVAMELKINYLKPTPLQTILQVRSVIDKTEGDHVYLSGEIAAKDRILTHAEGCFHKIDPDRVLEAKSRKIRE